MRLFRLEDERELWPHSVRELRARQLTGRTRWRLGLFGRPVLQVEVRSPMPLYPAAPPPPGIPVDPWERGSYRFWRDASPLDEITAG